MDRNVGISFALQHADDLVCGVFVNLEPEPPVGHEHPPPCLRDGPVEADAVVVRDEQRHGGFVVADVGVHLRAVAFGHIGRVRHDRVETLRECLRQSAERVGLAERDPGVERPEILRGDGQRVIRNIGRENLRVGKPQRQRRRDAAASGPHVENPPGPALAAQHPVHQLLGFGTRNQHSRAHGEAVPVKFGVSDDVLQRFSGRKTLRDLLRPLRGDLRPGIGQQRRQRDSRELCDGVAGYCAGFALSVEGHEACGQSVDGIAAGHRRMKLARAMATAASTTTAPRRATQVSWRPRISSGSTRPVASL